MRVVYERTALELDATGTARAVIDLQAELQRRGDVELLPIAQRASRGRIGTHRIARGLARELGWLPFGVGHRARALHADLLHCPAPLAPPVDPGLPMVVTVHDALPRRHPEWFTRATVLAARHVLPRALRRAAVVLAPTEHARADIADAYQLDPARIVVAPLGVGPRFFPAEPDLDVLARLGVERPYLLTAGTLQPRKNVSALLAAFHRLAADGLEHRLVVAGARGWRDADIAASLDEAGQARRIRFPGRVEDSELVELYRGAAAFIYPSRYEGFGLPPLEAMACGTPVVCSDRTSLPEVAGDAALLVDPDDADDLARAIARALHPAKAKWLRERGQRRAAQFTWERCAEATVAGYRQALSHVGRSAVGVATR